MHLPKIWAQHTSGATVENDGINDDHPFDKLQQPRISSTKHKPQSTIQDNRLAGDYEHPSEGVDCYSDR